MSRIGRAPITVPAGVEVKVEEGNCVTVKGAKGTLTRTFAPSLTIKVEGNTLTVERPNDEKQNRALHGLTRTLIYDMVVGVSEGFSKTLEIQGVGYTAEKKNDTVILNIGYSHPVIIKETSDIQLEVPGKDGKGTTIIVKGIDKQKVGQFAADTRAKRPPEPYKGKGIRYQGEVVRIKEGKTGTK